MKRFPFLVQVGILLVSQVMGNNDTIVNTTSHPPSSSMAPSPSPTRAPEERRVVVLTKFDTYPNETSWEIREASNGEFVYGVSAFGVGQGFAAAPISVPLRVGGVYNFGVMDSGGNGFCCGGFAAVYLGLEPEINNYLALVEDNFGSVTNRTFAVSETATFTVTSSPTETPSMTPTVAPTSGGIPFVSMGVTISFLLSLLVVTGVLW